MSVSFWEDLENVITAQVKTVTALASSSAPTPYLSKEPPESFPCANISRGGRKKVEAVTQFGCTRVVWDAEFSVLVRCRLSGPEGAARLGTGYAYNLADQVLSALVGFTAPGLTTASTITPVLPVSDQIFDVSETQYDILLDFVLRVQTQYRAP